MLFEICNCYLIHFAESLFEFVSVLLDVQIVKSANRETFAVDD